MLFNQFLILIGLAEYIAILDVDEFFIPKGKNGNFLDVLKSINQPHSDDWLGDTMLGRLIENLKPEDKKKKLEDKHPFCYVTVMAELVFSVKDVGIDSQHPWMGDRFAHGCEPIENSERGKYDWMKAIIPTELIFQGSNSGPGACKLPLKWTSCGVDKNPAILIGNDSYCGDGLQNPAERSMSNNDIHDFDYTVYAKDSYFLNMHNEGSIFHFLAADVLMGLHATAHAFKTNSIYTQNYFPSVLQDIRRRGLEMMIVVKDNIPIAPQSSRNWESGGLVEEDMDTDIHHHFIKKVLNKFPELHVDNIDSVRQDMDYMELPNFAIDYSDYALGIGHFIYIYSFICIFFLCACTCICMNICNYVNVCTYLFTYR
jgi:hypothetical protein